MAVSPIHSFPRIPGKTVYFLGSGFSKPYGLPMIADFIDEGMIYIKSTNQRKLVQRMMRILDLYIPTLRMVCNDRDTPSIADLFCIVDLLDPKTTGCRRTLEEFVVTVCQRQPPVRFKSAVDEIWFRPDLQVKSYLMGLHPRARNDPSGLQSRNTVSAYEAFIAHLLAARHAATRPTVISLNYDLVLEQTLQHMADNYEVKTTKAYPLNLSYGNRIRIGKACRQFLKPLDRRDPGTVYLIKLHGSINWQATRGRVVVDSCVPSPGRRLAAAQNTLIWPSWLRGTFETFYADLLAQARHELKSASEIVIIGYSMPILDRHIKYLLADVLSTPELPKVTICGKSENGNKEEIRNIWEQFGGTLAQKVKPQIYADGFVAYCQELEQQARRQDIQL